MGVANTGVANAGVSNAGVANADVTIDGVQEQCVSGQNEGIWLQFVVHHSSNFNHGSLPWHVLEVSMTDVANVSSDSWNVSSDSLISSDPLDSSDPEES